MSFYLKLRNKLENKLPEKFLDQLPRSYQILGKILIIKLKPGLLKYRKEIGKNILKILPYIHTIVLEKEIRGAKRKPKIEIIAGCHRKPSLQTLHKEHGCQFLLDVSKIMWSKGNKEERQRYVKSAKPKETVVDMFSGIGYFSIFLAKKVKKIYAIDMNPKAIEYLRKNIWLNKVEDKIEVLEGDCRRFSRVLGGTADRIIMGYLFETEKFLPYALKIAKKNCIIHFHRILKIEEIEKTERKLIGIAKKNKVNIKIIRFVRVKSYAPKVWHVVFDLQKR